MIQLPGAADAQVDDAKVRDYLLNPGNPQNGGKSALFEAFGFSRADWPLLLRALKAHPVANTVVSQSRSRYGVKFVVRCSMVTPDNRNPCLTTVWVTQPDAPSPRLVTAY